MAEPTETLILDLAKGDKPTLGGISLEYESTMVSFSYHLTRLSFKYLDNVDILCELVTPASLLQLPLTHPFNSPRSSWSVQSKVSCSAATGKQKPQQTESLPISGEFIN